MVEHAEGKTMVKQKDDIKGRTKNNEIFSAHNLVYFSIVQYILLVSFLLYSRSFFFCFLFPCVSSSLLSYSPFVSSLLN